MHGGNDLTVTLKNSPVGRKNRIADNENARTVLYESKYHNVYLAKDAEQYMNDIFARIATLGENSPEAYEIYQNIDYALITKEDLETLDLSEIKQAVILPGRSFVHILDAERILSADGIERIINNYEKIIDNLPIKSLAFKWERIADKYAELYQKLSSNR